MDAGRAMKGDLNRSGFRPQMSGLLYKRRAVIPVPPGVSGKWTKRFFIVRDSFLLYYSEGERREFEKHRLFNPRPKGVIPLGNCEIQSIINDPCHPFCLQLTSAELSTSLLLSAENEYDLRKWDDVLHQASRITWSNAQMSDVTIKQLESQGLHLAQEKQNYVDKLQVEAVALQDEKSRNEMLEQMNEELEKERNKMESLTNELKEQYDHIKRELEETTSSMKSIENTKVSLLKTNKELHDALQSLDKEKTMTLTKLKNGRQAGKNGRPPLAKIPSQSSDTLNASLNDIETKMAALVNEKMEIEKQMRDNEEQEKLLEEEKRAISEQADDLQESLRDLEAHKSLVENELKEEVFARVSAKNRLRDAEGTLTHLENAIQKQGTEGCDYNVIKDEMMGGVKSLKSFFEKMSNEAELDPDVPVMMKNSLYARKSIVKKAKTMKFESLKRSRSRTSTQEQENATV